MNFLGPCIHKDKDCHIASKFCKFYLIKTDFTLGEQVYLVEMFKPFILKRVLLCSKCRHGKRIKQESLMVFLKHESQWCQLLH